MDRIEEFTLDGKNFVYIDFSDLTTNEEISRVVATAEAAISAYPFNSVFTISNFEGFRFNHETKNLIIPYLEANEPYVKAGALVGLDHIKRIMANTLFAVSGRKELIIMHSKEEALEFFESKF